MWNDFRHVDAFNLHLIRRTIFLRTHPIILPFIMPFRTKVVNKIWFCCLVCRTQRFRKWRVLPVGKCNFAELTSIEVCHALIFTKQVTKILSMWDIRSVLFIRVARTIVICWFYLNISEVHSNKCHWLLSAWWYIYTPNGCFGIGLINGLLHAYSAE